MNDRKTYMHEVLTRFAVLYGVFILFYVASIFLGINLDKIAEQIMNYFSEYLDSTGLSEATGIKEAALLFLNNARVSLGSMCLGFIPFLYVPICFVVLNAIIAGLVIGFSSTVMNTSALLLTVCGILPHGIFEITAIVFSAAIGFELCDQLIRLIVGKTIVMPFDKLVKTSFLLFLKFPVPLLIIAALIETYITPVIMKAFV